jgi:hypothetical protein
MGARWTDVRARHGVGHSLIVVALHDTLTAAERNLQRMGEHERLRDVRTFFQYATVQGFCEPIERITGRRVRSFVGGMDTQTDMADRGLRAVARGHRRPTALGGRRHEPSAGQPRRPRPNTMRTRKCGSTVAISPTR